MLFTSLEFLFLFFPIVIGTYFLLAERIKNYWLLAASLFFYAWGEPKFVLVMIASILFNYVAAIIVGHLQKNLCNRCAKGALTLAILGNCSVLFLYKYCNFITDICRTLFPGWQGIIPQTSFVLPIGISFFTFQAMSYIIDVYRGVPAQKNPAFLGLYIALFPQLIAGPIVRYTTIRRQIEYRKVTFGMFSQGVLRFLYGFNKKMLLANLFAIVADKAFEMEGLSVSMAWLGAICYTLQIYFDFSGYSEMAIGLGLMFGFNFPMNFNYPYIAKSATEFWRRWHISLGSWFRDYLYFPLGGSRVKNKVRLSFNLFLTWFTTGIWHGANWTFIVWGALYGVMITAEKWFSVPQKLESGVWWRGLYRGVTLLAVVCGWVIFRAENLTAAGDYLKIMAGGSAVAWIDDAFYFHFNEIKWVLLVGILCSIPLFKTLTQRLAQRQIRLAKALTTLGYAVQLLLFLIGVSYLIMNAHNPFIYFNF